MEFDNVFLKINEIVHNYIKKYKEKVIADDRFSEITVSQLLYIEAINNLSNPSLSQLADYLHLARASVSNAVQKLDENGYVQKIQSSEDKRIFYLKLSERGQLLIDAEKNAMGDFINKLESMLSDEEKRVIINAFKKIIKEYRD